MFEGLIKDWPKRVCFGQGSVRRLPEIMRDLGAKRAMVVCGASVAAGPMLEKVRAALGDRFAGAFTDVVAHTPFERVEKAVALLKRLGADTIVTVGGGSAIDAGKGIALLVATGGVFAPFVIDYGKTGMARAAMPDPGIFHIAVPTTAGSASDVMPTAGIRDPKLGKKLLFWDDRMVPDATVLDPEMAIHASPFLTAATGMTAMARCIECLYSKDRHPISTGLALHAARLLRRSLPRSVAMPGDLEARAECLVASIMSGTASINAMVSAVHAIGHIVGGKYALQHGVSHRILLAPAMRRLLPAIGEDQFYVLEAMGGARDGLSAEATPAVVASTRAATLTTRCNERVIGRLHVPRL